MTFIQRLDSILTGTKDAAPTNATAQKVSSAFVDSMNDAEILEQFGKTRDLLTNGEKAEVAVLAVKKYIRDKVQESPRAAALRAVYTTTQGDTTDL